jgi:hypothetical protein
MFLVLEPERVGRSGGSGESDPLAAALANNVHREWFYQEKSCAPMEKKSKIALDQTGVNCIQRICLDAFGE